MGKPRQRPRTTGRTCSIIRSVAISLEPQKNHIFGLKMARLSGTEDSRGSGEERVQGLPQTGHGLTGLLPANLVSGFSSCLGSSLSQSQIGSLGLGVYSSLGLGTPEKVKCWMLKIFWVQFQGSGKFQRKLSVVLGSFSQLQLGSGEASAWVVGLETGLEVGMVQELRKQGLGRIREKKIDQVGSSHQEK